jgi:hypothetical protein
VGLAESGSVAAATNTFALRSNQVWLQQPPPRDVPASTSATTAADSATIAAVPGRPKSSRGLNFPQRGLLTLPYSAPDSFQRLEIQSPGHERQSGMHLMPHRSWIALALVKHLLFLHSRAPRVYKP